MSSTKKSNHLRWLCISLVVIFLGALLSYCIDTNWGTVKVERLKLISANGYNVSGVIRIPKTATPENPAPAFIFVPGGDCNADIAAPWAIELTRRGYVTVAVDYSGAGDTGVDPTKQYFGSNGAMELDTIYDYLTSLNFVDTDQIGVGGHSMGSLYSFRLALQRKVAVVVSDVLFMDAMPDYDFNFIQLTALHDEGILARIPTYEAIYTDPFLTGLFGVERIEPNKLYGSWENRTARVFYEFNQTHQDDMISAPLISKMVNCVMQAMPVSNQLNPDSVIYWLKIVGLTIAIIGMIMFLFSLSGALLETKAFGRLVLKPGERVGFEPGTTHWWVFAVILTLLPVATFFPGTGIGNKMMSNSQFKLGTTPNGYMTWALLSAVVVLLVFALYHFTYGKKQNGNLKNYGLATVDQGNKITIKYLLWTILFSFVVLACAYAILVLIFYYAKTDLHIVVQSMRPLSGERFSTYPWYLLAFLPYFFALMLISGTLNYDKGNTNEGKGLWKSVVWGSISGVVGLVLLYLVFQIILRFTSIGPFTTKNFAQFYMTLLSSVLPVFVVATALGIYLNKKTNSKWAGTIIGSALVAFVLVSSTCLMMVIRG